MNLTPANLQFIFFQFDQRFKKAYEAQPIFWDRYASMAPSNSRETHYGWIGKIPRLNKGFGERLIHNLAARGYVVVNDLWRDAITLTRTDIEDDQFGLYAQSADTLGQQARLWPDDMLTAKIESGTTDTCYDGQPFFHNAHPVDVDKSNSTTYQNRFDSAANGGGVGFPLNHDNYRTVRAKMMKYQGEDGRSLNVVPDLLMVPPLLEVPARQIVQADMIAPSGGLGAEVAQAQTNVLKGTADVLVNPYLTSDTAWYLLCTKRAIKPMIFQLRAAPEFTYLNKPEDPNVFFQEQYIFGVRARGAAGYSLPFLAARGDV